ncbi:MAG: hypothetical protein ABJL72_01815 [Roseobacter sp.]
MRLSFFGFVAIFSCGAGIALAQEQDHQRATITMGVRQDVPPFVWRDEESEEFSGFFWDICTAALARSGYMFEPVLIDAPQRSALLATGNFCLDAHEGVQTCPAGRERTVDLLCDPTTITLDRMRIFADASKIADQGKEPDASSSASDFVFSPILFLANGSYIKQVFGRSKFRENLEKELEVHCSDNAQINAVICQDEDEDKNKPLEWIVPPSLRETQEPVKIDWQEACKAITSALAADRTGKSEKPDDDGPKKWPPQIWPEPTLEKPQFEIWGYVSGATVEASILEAAARAPQAVGICPQAFKSHTKAAEAFCAKRIYRYFGDVDLVRARVANYRASNAAACDADETPSAKGTYEPYALVLSHKRDEHFPERFNSALFSMFSDGTITRFFDGRFGYQKRSQYLETLFQINSLPDGLDP